VHIHQRESLHEHTVGLQGGSCNTWRGFIVYSPQLQRADVYLAYEGSYTDGPFQNPGRYRRDNVNANYTRSLNDHEKVGFRAIFGRNDFYSSGQLPLDLVDAGQLERFGYMDPSDGGRVRLGTLSAYFSKVLTSGDTFQADGFVSRSLFDLYSNFTYYLNDPVDGDAFQQHDSRIQEAEDAIGARSQTGRNRSPADRGREHPRQRSQRRSLPLRGTRSDRRHRAPTLT
jgi:hypothetical protein